MSFQLTPSALNQALKINVEPQLVLSIDGVSTKYGLVEILRYVRVGDPGLEIGDDWVIGGYYPDQDQETALSLSGTTTRIQQQLDPDRGAVSSISSMQVALIDFNNSITELITPGQIVDDILGRKAKVSLGFRESSFPHDFIDIFRGVIDDVNAEPGKITLNIAHPDQKKRQKIFLQRSTKLTNPITNIDTTLTLDSTTGFLDSSDPSTFKNYVRIDDEIIEYSGISGLTLTGCTRGQLGTVAASHAAQADVETINRLTGDAMTLALKLMLSGVNGPFTTGVTFKSFGVVATNAIYFYDVDVKREYGIVEGDLVTTTGALNGANNVSNKVIQTIEYFETGSYIVLSGVSFVYEDDTAATLSFRSKYDTLGEGLAMSPDEVDVEQHEYLYRLFLSSFQYDFYLKEEIEGRDFINQEIYLPASCFATPRKSKASVGYHIGPIPGSNILKIDDSNVTNAEKIKIRRSTNRNFFNTIVYKYDEDSLDDKFLKGYVLQDLSSKAQIKIGNKVQTIVSKGLRTSLSADTLAQQAGSRKIDRYAFAAEMIEAVEVKYGVAFNSEVGDIVLFDGANLKISDIKSASREFQPRLMEITNKSIDIKTGQVVLTLTDTNFSATSRYCLIGSSSLVKSGSSQTQFVIEPDGYFSQYGVDEFKNWNKFTLPSVRVRSADFSVISPIVEITNVVGNSITVSAPLGFTPSPGHILELGEYNDTTQEMNLVYGFMRDVGPFDDGSDLYKML